MDQTTSNFLRFEAAIRRFSGDARSSDLLLGRDGNLSCYYTPIDWKNSNAKIMLIGITPGLTQAQNALATARRQLEHGADCTAALAEAKREGAFSGAMRPNLIALLNHIAVNRWLGVDSCSALFAEASGLLQSASVLPYPVFAGDSNYNGTPDPVRTPFLQRLVMEHFTPFLETAPQALVVPLGPVPTKVIQWLVEKGRLDRDRVLDGLPHPSGANAERIAYFVGKKPREALSAKTDPSKLDAARSRLTGRIARLIEANHPSRIMQAAS